MELAKVISVKPSPPVDEPGSSPWSIVGTAVLEGHSKSANLLREFPWHRYAVRVEGEEVLVDYRSVFSALGYAGKGRPRVKYGYSRMSVVVMHEEVVRIEHLGDGSFGAGVRKLIDQYIASSEPFG